MCNKTCLNCSHIVIDNWDEFTCTYELYVDGSCRGKMEKQEVVEPCVNWDKLVKWGSGLDKIEL